jgi:prepilin-type N-terminal cleavage/methylation domain-containing protein
VGLGGRGMTLIEVMVATAIVMAVALATSDGIIAVKAVNARADRHRAADAVAAAEIAKLGALPFAPATSSSGTGATDVVSCVFPNADPDHPASPDTGFVPEPRDGCPAGSYFTTSQESAGRMTIAATFVAGTADGWRAVPLTLLVGYDLRRSAYPPSAALLVRVTVAWTLGRLAGAVTRSAVVSNPAQGPCRVAAPPAPPAA